MRHYGRPRLAAFALGVAALAAQANAEERPEPDKSAYTLGRPVPNASLRDMDSDRPNKTDTPHTIDAGHMQVETGLVNFVRERDRSHGADILTEILGIGQINVRVGVTNNLELNAFVNAYVDQRVKDRLTNESARQRGFGDLVIGGKLNVWGNDGDDAPWSTALAIKPQLKLPTAHRGVGNRHVELFVGFPFSVNLPGEFHLGLQTTVSAERNAADSGYATGWQNSISIDRALIGKAVVYLEYWSKAFSERSRSVQQTADVGLTYPLTRNVLLDTGFNFGLSRASPSFEWLTGVSVRW